jgi:multiple antibiotic resistance protein
MMEFVDQFLRAFVAMFIITDSIGNLPFFIGLTEDMTVKERRDIFNTAIVTGALLLAVFVFTGSIIFNLFALTLDDMRIAGGILLLLIAIEIMVKGRIVVEHKEDVGVVPLGCPLLVGPGAITSALVMIHVYNFYAVLAGIIACFFFIWLTLHFAENLYGLLGRNGALIITKIAAILIAAISIQFIRQGIQGAIMQAVSK